MKLENHILGILIDDINHNRLELPMLPEIALQTRQVVECPESTAADIAAVVSTDAVISARLLRLANSPLYRAGKPIDNIKRAIARLGSDAVRNLVTGLVLEQLYQTTREPWLDDHLRALWQHSIRVAATSQILARQYTQLSPDQALLAGLIHDIGAIPLYSKAISIPELTENEPLMQHIVRKLHALAGTAILDEWRFPQALIDVVANHEHGAPDDDGPVDYVDIVVIANAFDHAEPQWHLNCPLAKLGITAEELANTLKQGSEEVNAVQQSFAMG